MKFLLDANIPYSAKEVFPKRHRVFHVRDVGLQDSPDDEIINYAKKKSLVLITKDLDFANIQNYPLKKHSGIVIIRVPFYFTASQINKVISQFFTKDISKDIPQSITVVEPGAVRIRKLK